MTFQCIDNGPVCLNCLIATLYSDMQVFNVYLHVEDLAASGCTLEFRGLMFFFVLFTQFLKKLFSQNLTPLLQGNRMLFYFSKKKMGEGENHLNTYKYHYEDVIINRFVKETLQNVDC